MCGIVQYYALFISLQTFSETKLIKIWKRAVYSELVLKIWILFGEEGNNNKLTHFNRLKEEYEKFCDEKAVRLQSVKEAFSKWVDLKKLGELIGKIQTDLKNGRNFIAHVDFKNLSYQDDLIKECAEICCKLCPFITAFRRYSYDPNLDCGQTGIYEGNIEGSRESFGLVNK